MNSPCDKSALLVFSHLRWDLVFQRPQHLLIRHAKHRKVFYFEEPIFGMSEIPMLQTKMSPENVQIIVPYLPSTIRSEKVDETLKKIIDDFIYKEKLKDFTICYYSPTAVNFTRHLKPTVTIFDCMEGMSAPQSYHEREEELFENADLVFIGGNSLYEAKKEKCPNIHQFPNSIDLEHFAQGRLSLVEPEDQMNIPHPRIGFYGVIDERFNFDLLRRIAEIRPEFQFVLVGPILIKDSSKLPTSSNIHYLGKKNYHTLPLYLAGWDCTMIPFALNDHTRFISPTKTSEFLAAGKPVVSTSINDVIHPYNDAKLVYIADHPEHFVECLQTAMNECAYDPEWLERVDLFLDGNSWDLTFIRMASLEKQVRQSKSKKVPVYLDESLSAIGIV